MVAGLSSDYNSCYLLPQCRVLISDTLSSMIKGSANEIYTAQRTPVHIRYRLSAVISRCISHYRSHCISCIENARLIMLDAY